MAAHRASAGGGGTSGGADRTVTFAGATAGDLLVVFAATSGNTNTAPTCSDDNSAGAYDLIGTALWGTSANIMSVFVRRTRIPTTVSTIITVATGSNTAGQITVDAISGMAKVGSGAVRTSGNQANQPSGGTPAPALGVAALTENMTLGCIANSSNPATVTPPVSWTEQQDIGVNLPSTGNEMVTRDSGFTGTTVTWGSTSPSVFSSFILELNSHDDGTLAKTLGAVTSSATGTVRVQGTSTRTLGAATSSATGTVKVQGTSTRTLGAATSSATGTVRVQGTSTRTLGAVTSSATGTVKVQGTSTRTLGAVTSSATGAVKVQGTSTRTLGAVTSSATGAVSTLVTVLSDPSGLRRFSRRTGWR